MNEPNPEYGTRAYQRTTDLIFAATTCICGAALLTIAILLETIS